MILPRRRFPFEDGRGCPPAGERRLPFGRLLAQVAADGPLQPRIEELVRAVGLRRFEAARHLVLAAGAALEHLNPTRDALIDRVIEAHVEVKKWVLFMTAPVAAIKVG